MPSHLRRFVPSSLRRFPLCLTLHPQRASVVLLPHPEVDVPAELDPERVEEKIDGVISKIHEQIQGTRDSLSILGVTEDISPDEADSLYGIRFNIETGYRDKHLFQARTTSKEMAVRFFILLFAIILWNICQMFLFIVSRGSTGHLNQVVKWRRELRTIKLFLLRDELL